MNRRGSARSSSHFRSLLAALGLAVAARAQYVVDFEGQGETKTGYASGTVTLSGLDWNMTEALIGGGATGDWKNGDRSARMRGYAASSMTMLVDKTGGLGTLSFKYRRYGDDSQVDWRVEYSTDAGANWTPAGGDFTPPASDDVQLFSEGVNLSGNVRIRIRRATESGSSNRRMCIDDITLTDFGSTSGPPVVSTAPIHAITSTTATGGGEVLNENGADVTERGVVWNTTGTPTTDDEAAASGDGLGPFTAGLAGLVPGQVYFVRAYAQNVYGVGYGVEETFRAAGFADAPVLEPVTQRYHDGFLAEWTIVDGATAYWLEVASDERFSPGGIVTLVGETMGTVGATTAISAHDDAGGFDHSGTYVYGDGGAENPGDVRGTSVSSGYVDPAGNAASGGANIWLTETAGDRGFAIGGIDARDHADLRLGFGYRKESADDNANFILEWSADAGLNWHALALTGLPAADATAGWYFVENLELPPSAAHQASLSLRWVKRGTIAMRIDDVLLRGDRGAASLHPRYAGLTVTETAHRVNRLSPGVYHVRVRAIGAENCFSAFSNAESAPVRGGILLLLR